MKKRKNELSVRTKGDIAALSLILAAALISFLLPAVLYGRQSGGEAVILCDGEEYGKYLLSEDALITVPYKDGGYNLILIEKGAVRVTDADCPDQLCMKHRTISRNSESIICLPHKLVITIKAGEESDLDAVTN